MLEPGSQVQNAIYLAGGPEWPVSPEDWERRAAETLAQAPFDYVAGGAGSEATVRANRAQVGIRAADIATAKAQIARSNASSLAFDGFVNPLIFRTNWSDAARTSSSVTGGSKLNSGRMFRHIPPA